jgi:hypothetical protein
MSRFLLQRSADAACSCMLSGGKIQEERITVIQQIKQWISLCINLAPNLLKLICAESMAFMDLFFSLEIEDGFTNLI